MRSDELVTALRMTAYIGDAAAFPQYPDARLLAELNDKLQSVFNEIIVKARAGYWLKQFDQVTVAGRARYRIPPRSVVGGLEKVEISLDSGGTFFRITQEQANIAQQFRTANAGTPAIYTIQGDQIELISAPATAIPLRLSYYIRPSRLVTSQSSTAGGDAVVRGLITAVNTTARTITVNAIPFDESLTVPAVMTSALQSIDVVHPDGWHELALVSAAQTFAGLVYTIGGTADLSDVAVGDFVRVAEQTDWPCLPDDFHRCLADAAAVKTMIELSMQDKADSVAGNAGNDIERFRSLLSPRVKAEPKTIGCFPSRGARSYDWLRRY